MARYGIDFYGTAPYGSPSFVDFDATPFEVIPVDAGINQLSWVLPDGDWTRFRLVRNAYGWPVHEDDGVVLLDTNSGPVADAPRDPPLTDFTDTDLQAGRLFYYSIFLLAFDTTNQHTEWIRAADATGISVGKYNYTERMLNLLPEAYWADPSSESGRNDQFTGFLSIFGFQLDLIRSQYESLRSVHDPDKVAAALLPVLGDMFGVSYEPEIGIRQHRAMVRNAIYIARRKSTLAGTNTLVSSFTGWDADITVGTNLMLDYNDSSAEESIGRWYSDTCVLSRRPGDGIIAAWQSSQFVNKQDGMLMLTSKVGGSHDPVFGSNHINAHIGGYHPIAAGIPVTPGATYTFSAYLRAVTTGRNCNTAIRWCDSDGKRIGADAGTQIADTTDTWVRPTATATAPATARYAVLIIDLWGVPTTGGESHVVDAMQFELGSTATAFQEARDIRVVLSAERINELPNPSAELDTTGWTATGGTLSRDTTVAFSGVLSSTTPSTAIGTPNVASFLLTSTGAASGTATGPLIPVDADTDYTLSGYVYGQQNPQLSIAWFDQNQQPIGDPDLGQALDWVNGAWIRPEATGTAPDDAYYAQISVTGQFTDSGQSIWFDQVLFERSPEVRPYFDASQFHSRPADHLWEGAPHASRSHYYFNRTAKQFRLDATLNDYLLPCRTHTLLVAQPFQWNPGAYSEDSGYGWGPYGQVPYPGTPSHGFGTGSYGGVPYLI